MRIYEHRRIIFISIMIDISKSTSNSKTHGVWSSTNPMCLNNYSICWSIQHQRAQLLPAHSPHFSLLHKYTDFSSKQWNKKDGLLHSFILRPISSHTSKSSTFTICSSWNSGRSSSCGWTSIQLQVLKKRSWFPSDLRAHHTPQASLQNQTNRYFM